MAMACANKTTYKADGGQSMGGIPAGAQSGQAMLTRRWECDRLVEAASGPWGTALYSCDRPRRLAGLSQPEGAPPAGL